MVPEEACRVVRIEAPWCELQSRQSLRMPAFPTHRCFPASQESVYHGLEHKTELHQDSKGTCGERYRYSQNTKWEMKKCFVCLPRENPAGQSPELDLLILA